MLPTTYQAFIHASRYARWNDKEQRRETWPETVDRYIHFWALRFAENNVVQEVLPALRSQILHLDVMPSMRSLMTAGPALDRDNMAGYNCSYIAVDSPRAFDEAMYILMCGTGVGFSVERQYVSQLPVVAESFIVTDSVIHVADSRIGWAGALRELIAMLYAGRVPRWDVSTVREAGTRLKTFGGRASGPGPLCDLFTYVTAMFTNAAGRKLTSIECHDLMCKIGDVVVVGGVRRSALVSLSNLSDDRMRQAKTGQWWERHPERTLANNSVAYTERPDFLVFQKEWLSMYESFSGERGIFNRVAATNKAGENGRRSTKHDFGTNPCGEIILRSNGLCNLSEVVIRPHDDKESLMRKVEAAVILGTLQASLTNFRYVRKVWKDNAEEEALLGVSLTGIMDNLLTNGVAGTRVFDRHGLNGLLFELRQHAIKVNAHWAPIIGVQPAAAITCVKPSGTVSQLVDSASGIHPRYARYYIRRVAQDNKDPLTAFLKAQGVPHEPHYTKPQDMTVFAFPMEAPEGAATRHSLRAERQLDLYKQYRDYWCEHNPSITVYYRDEDFYAVGQWVWDHFDEIGGIAFLPHDGGVYKQAPYEEIDEATFKRLTAEFPKVDWSMLPEFERKLGYGDQTKASHELACAGGVCEI